MSIYGDLEKAGISTDGKSIQLLGLGGKQGAKLFGAGTSANPAVSSTNGMNFLQFYFRHDGTSGDNRGLYLRTRFNGGAGGDAARLFATVDTDCGTVHGAHISLSFTAGKQVSGQGIANRCTLHIPDDVLSTGTIAAIQAEAFMDGNSAGPGSAAHGLIRAIVDGGDATAKARFKNFLLATLPAGSGNMFETGLTAATVNAATTAAIKVSINGTAYWIPVATAIS